MAFGDIAKLLASLDLDTRPFEKGAGRVSGDLSKMEGGLGRVSTRAIALGSAVGVGIERLAEKGISVLFGAVQAGEENLHILQDSIGQTQAVIESTGGVAGVTAQQVRDLAESIETLTTVDDKNVQAGENVLLRYTAIGRDIFPQASKAATDLAVALAKGDAANADVAQSAAQIGKALQDPIKGLTTLRKAGVVFTAQEQDQIKALVKAGDTMGAQEAILKALEVRYGKAGEAAGKTGAAGVRRLNDAVEDAQIALAEGLAPALDDIRNEIAAGLSDPGTQRDLRNLGVFLGDAAKSGLAFAKSVPWGQIAEGLKIAAGFAGSLIKTFANLPPGVQATIVGLAGLNKLAGGGVIKIGVDLFKEGAQDLFKGLFQRGSSPANPVFVSGTGIGGGGVPQAGGGLGLLGGGLALIGVAGIELAIADQIGKGLRLAVTGSEAPLKEDHVLATLGPVEVGLFRSQIQAIREGTGILKPPLTQIAKNTSGSPDQRDERQRQAVALAKQLDEKTAKLTARVEGTGATTKQRLDAAKAAMDRDRDAVEAARIAITSRQTTTSQNIQATTRTGAQDIVAAINRLPSKINVPVTANIVFTGVPGGSTTLHTTTGHTGGGARRG